MRAAPKKLAGLLAALRRYGRGARFGSGEMITESEKGTAKGNELARALKSCCQNATGKKLAHWLKGQVDIAVEGVKLVRVWDPHVKAFKFGAVHFDDARLDALKAEADVAAKQAEEAARVVGKEAAKAARLAVRRNARQKIKLVMVPDVPAPEVREEGRQEERGPVTVVRHPDNRTLFGTPIFGQPIRPSGAPGYMQVTAIERAMAEHRREVDARPPARVAEIERAFMQRFNRLPEPHEVSEILAIDALRTGRGQPVWQPGMSRVVAEHQPTATPGFDSPQRGQPVRKWSVFD